MSDPLRVAILRFPAVGEPHEFDALFREGSVRARWVADAAGVEDADLVILPGSEKTLADLAWMREHGLDAAVMQAHRRGAVLLGICGGFQVMGARLRDPQRREGGGEAAEGLRLLDLDTEFGAGDPIEEPTVGTALGGLLPEGHRVSGRELHGGRSTLHGDAHVPLFGDHVKGGGSCPLGIATRDLGVIGTYLHDVIEDQEFRARLLELVRSRRRAAQAAQADAGVRTKPPSAT